MKLWTMRNILLSLLMIGIPLFLYTSCEIPDSSEGKAGYNLTDAQNRKSTILKIEDTLYSNSDFEKYVRATLGEDQEALTVVSLSRLFDNFVDEKILLHAARAQNMVLTDKEKEDYLAKLFDELGTEDRDISLDEGDRDVLFERLLIEKYTYELVRTVEVQEVEIKGYYELHRRDFLRPERVKVSQILLETENKAVEVLESVRNADEEGFRKMAREVSVGLEALKGGEMGVFEMGQLPFEMEKVIFSLQEGELSSVVKTSYGYHIFRVDNRFDPKLISEEEASSSIREILLNQKIEERISRHLEDLKLSIVWSFYPLNLPFPYQRIDI
ncbi:MAG: peptidylprolyl isomerase [Candidatus Aminicenantes bacterium]|nr:peptidylprolyl isomerase [Candidatus Aminicenantes bacterium]